MEYECSNPLTELSCSASASLFKEDVELFLLEDFGETDSCEEDEAEEDLMDFER